MDIDSGPRDPSLLHLRSTEIWRLGGGDSQRCRRRNPNHTRLPNLHRRMFHLLQSTGFNDGEPVIGVTLGPGMSWIDVVESVFDHSGGLVHCMWIPYLQDLDVVGGYAWGAALWAWERLPTIAPLRIDLPLVDEDFWAGDLAGPLGARWLVSHSFLEKTGRTLYVFRVVLDELGPSHFIWMPYLMDVIDSLSPYCLTGRHVWRYSGPMICIFIVEPLMVDRVLRQFGMLQSIPVDAEYSKDHHRLTLQGNTSVNWVQKHQPSINIWNSRLDHIFESELIDGDSAVPEYHAWYVERTRRFHSRLGGLHTYIGDLLKTIAERTQLILPDVCHLVTEGWHHIQDRSLHWLFEVFPLDERRHKEIEGRQVAGHRAKRGGHVGGWGGAYCVRHRGNGGVVDQVVPTDHGEDYHDAADIGHDHNETHLGDNNDVAHLGDDHDSLVREENHSARGPIHVVEPIDEGNSLQQGLKANPPPSQQPIQQPSVQHSHQPSQHSIDGIPSFNLGLTPGGLTPSGSLIPTPQPVEQLIQQRTLQRSNQSTHHSIDRPHQSTHHPISSIPSFDLGPTRSDDGNVDDGNGGSSSQSTQSPHISLTQVTNNPSNVINPTDSRVDRFEKVYEPRRSRRLRKPTNCGTTSKKMHEP
ncbi:hypothetical protein POM88_026073 [Heracleum sosnowskyi]|uniref:Aminotransferase-like plant mobile domain-containing protein n=1 Tax=Heracleum sosnowskyi TaxID=360622 RepID=A0AAD8I550_9APIA|nr:hypothetical protein POM88_026073 [Heracleum sosnowskyi]